MKKISLPARKELRGFLILWSTQALSALGSGMTSFALVLWSYRQAGSALTTALLMVCAYAPYVLLSPLAGAISDRWNKKSTMLACDALAALSTLLVLLLWRQNALRVGHLYLINALNGLMNTFQNPAADVAATLLTPEKHYQKIGALRSFSNSLTSVLTPILATALFTLAGLGAVIAFDLSTFLIAFWALALGIRLPRPKIAGKTESFLFSIRQGLRYLRQHRGILHIILFLAAINFTASIYNAALPALILSRPTGGEKALGLVQAAAGVAMLAGSALASLLPAPKSRVRVICNTLLFSMSTENFFLALGRGPALWCLGAVLGWVGIPLMNTNLDALLRHAIPLALQGRVYAARNSLQFFTIPLGYLLGGILVDQLFEPWMAGQTAGLPALLFGTGKGSGAAVLFLCLAFLGVITCLLFRRDSRIWALEWEQKESE